MRVKKEHSGSDDVVTKLKLEIQQLHEDSLLAKDLSTSRQHQNELAVLIWQNSFRFLLHAL